jgi:dolichyl-phosphate beta-glucosyltransferase
VHVGLRWEQLVRDRARLHARGSDCLRLCTLHRNQGKGAAIRKGMLRMRGRYGLMADADAATDIQDLDRLLSALQKIEVRRN